MNKNIAKNINKKVTNYNDDANVIVESTFFDDIRGVPSVKVQRHFSSSTNCVSSSSVQQRSSKDVFADGRLIDIPKLVEEDLIETERGAVTTKKPYCTNDKLSSRSYSSDRQHWKKTQIGFKKKEANIVQKNDLRSVNKPLSIRGAKLQSKQNKKSEPTAFDPVSTTDLRLNLDSIGNQLSLIEESLSLRKVESYQRGKRDCDNINQEMTALKNKLETIKRNTKIKSRHPQLSIFSLNENTKPYDPNDFMDTVDSTRDNDGIGSADRYEKLDQSLFVSQFGKSVAEMCNQSDNLLLNNLEIDSTCEFAEMEKVKRIRKELKKWKREYFSKTGEQFDDPLLESSCDL